MEFSNKELKNLIVTNSSTKNYWYSPVPTLCRRECHEGLDDDCPFIAIILQDSKPLSQILITTTLLRQSKESDTTRWENSGLTGLMHSESGFVNEFGIKIGATEDFVIKDKDNMEYLHHKYYNLFPTVKELLTTGSALYDPKNPAHGMFKLVKQG